MTPYDVVELWYQWFNTACRVKTSHEPMMTNFSNGYTETKFEKFDSKYDTLHRTIIFRRQFVQHVPRLVNIYFNRCCVERMPNVRLSLHWRHNDRSGVSNHQPHGCLLNRLFRHRSKKTSKLRVTGLCAGNSPVTGEFPAQRASNAENGSIWWRYHILNV